MKKQRFTEELTIGVLRDQEAGAKAADLCRKHVISEATFYNWNAKYGGITATGSKATRCGSFAFPQVAPTTPCGVSETADALIAAV
jgi:putative transposase